MPEFSRRFSAPDAAALRVKLPLIIRRTGTVVFALPESAVFQNGLGVPAASRQFAFHLAFNQSENPPPAGPHSQSIGRLLIHEAFAFNHGKAGCHACAV